MKTYAPDYYKNFHCIADKCKHSCCIGWDVYIDEDTEKKYRALPGNLGESIRACLCEKDDGVCFVMSDSGRCPFLDDDGLCRIILQKGEDCISEICREHPRFYNFFSDRAEVGLGISCEEAARIILSQQKIPDLAVIDEDDCEEEALWEDEAYVLEKRNEMLSLIRSDLSFHKTVCSLLELCGTIIPNKTFAEWAEIFSSLERLDSEWDGLLKILASCDNTLLYIDNLEIPLKNLLHYFVYRHVSAANEDNIAASCAFACLSATVIGAICNAEAKKSGNCSLEYLCNIARLYSAEIEYSEENTEKIISLLM